MARRLGLLDAPNPIVPQHRAPTAHMGGVAVALAAYGAVAIASALPGGAALLHGFGGSARAVLLAGLSFLMLGMVDDLLRLSARVKFAVQFVIAALAAAAGVRGSFLGIPLLDGALAVLLILATVNAVNLTDVCDGLVAGLAAAALLLAAQSQGPLAPWSLAAAGACIGFLVFNAPPARVFLGDAGSHWLGFMIVAAALTAKPVSPWIDATRTVLWCGVFYFELLLLIVARARKGIPFWQGSPDHFSLRLQAAGWSRWTTDLVAWTAGAALATLALRLPDLPPPLQVGLPLAALAAGIVLLLVLLFTADAPRPAGAPALEPPHLLWFHQNFVSGRQAGNARAMQLVAALLEAGWSVDVVTTHASYLDDAGPTGRTSLEIEREGRLTIHRLPHRGRPHRRGLSWISFCVRAALHAGRFRRVDAVLSSTPLLPQILVGALVSWTRRAPLVLELRDLWPLFLKQLGLIRSPLALIPAEWMEAFAYRAARHVVSVSPAFVPYLERMGVPSERITTAPTGVEETTLSDSERSLVRRECGWDESFVVIYAGSLNESHEISRLLEVAERTAAASPRIRWVIAGGGPGRRAVEAAAVRLPRLQFLGNVERDRLGPLLQAADVGVVSLGPHRVLQLVVPEKLFDYCSAGLPVLCTTDGMAGAIVRAAGAGSVLPDTTAETLAAAVLAIAEEPEAQRRDRARRSRAWLREHMRSADSARAIASVIQQIASPEAGRSQGPRMVRAAVGAMADVASRRSRRAAQEVLAGDLSTDSAARLDAWLRNGTRVAARDRPPLRVPRLLSARGEPSGI